MSRWEKFLLAVVFVEVALVLSASDAFAMWADLLWWIRR